MFEKVNLERALLKERSVQKEVSENQILSQFKALFEAEWEQDRRVLRTINNGATSSALPSSENLLEERIFDIDSIKNLCVKYRLRFLSTKQFKGDIPSTAISSIKETESKVGHNLDAFMIAAPSKLFKLEDSNKDPLLFAPLDDGRFYLIDKWGDDMAWYRKIVNWPLTSPITLLLTVLGLSGLLAAAVPSSLLSVSGEFFSLMRIVAFGWNVIFLMGITSYLWFASHAKFSIHAWNSKTFN
ncbi:hypothetical protein O3Q51_01505 [Cryomorphaceae bacterium 1068]|nr:hypothetical protein [Cryomorphaceae bacterium 1068]